MSTTLGGGLKHYPTSRAVIYTSLALPLLASLTATKYVYVLAYKPFIDQYGQFWRLLTYQLAYLNESEVLVSLVLMYHFRVLERLFSSRKYTSLIVLCYLYTLLTTSLIVPLNFYTGTTMINQFCSGPTTILFALLVHYREHIPVMYRFEVYGHGDNKIVLTDQFLVCLLSLQLSISQGWKSLGAALFGWILGAAIVRGILPGKSWRIPFWRQVAAFINKPNPVDRLLNRNREETPDGENDENATETRPLTSQFLDTFRR